MDGPELRGDDHSRVLRKSGLRPTRQRTALARLLFNGNRHVTAEDLHVEATAAGFRISLATVYNTLHQFREAGLLRELAVDGARTYFCTNTSNHSHFYIEREQSLLDIPADHLRVEGIPKPPDGFVVTHVDVVVRLVRNTAAGKAK